jgi:hypothetical protein
MNENPNETEEWKVTAAPRGSLLLPNVGHAYQVPCGTLAMAAHLERAARRPSHKDIAARLNIEWPSVATNQRVQGILFIEKNGFAPLLERAQIAERFDIAILTNQGQSVVASRKFVDEVCATNGGVPLFIVHDFDKSGFEIAKRLTSVSGSVDERDVAYRFKNEINVIDLGLRLDDARRYGLKKEQFECKGNFADDLICTDEEIAFLRKNQRIELNAFTSPQFVEWLESKLSEHLPGRLVPDEDVVEEAYRRAVALASLNASIEEAREKAITAAAATKIPKALRTKLIKEIGKHGTAAPEAWDKVLYRLASNGKM